MKYVIAAGVIILAAFLVALSMIPIGKEPLTELYFLNHTQLPKEVEPNQPTHYAFAIHNLEGHGMIYAYEVSVVSNHTVDSSYRNTIEIQDNQTATLAGSLSMKEDFSRSQLVVTLIGKNQSIDFWFTEKAT